MKTSSYLLRVFILLTIIFSQHIASGQDDFYYSRGEKIPLTISQEKICIKFKSGITEKQIETLLSEEPVLENPEPLRPAAAQNFYILHIKSETEIQQLSQRVRTRSEVVLVNPVYLIRGFTEAKVFDQFVVQFKPSVPRSEIDKLNSEHQVEIDRESTAAPNLFTLRVTSASQKSVVAMANLYYEDPRTEYSVPDFIQQWEFFGTPNDTYFQNQYYLHNTGQTGGTADADIDAPEAWDITTGSSSITIAVIDQGGQVHEDLPASRTVPGYDFFGDDSDPSPEGNEAHGMACAGIIAASQNNTLGISGLAPNCKIMHIKIANAYKVLAPNSDIASAIDFAWQNGADVLSNSWGDPSGEWNDDIAAAINRALTQGRNGKGSVVVFAAGNFANRFVENIAFPANVPGVLAVGATDKNDDIQNYSPQHPEIDVVAPSGNVGGCGGANDCNLHGDVWSLDNARRAWLESGDLRDWSSYLLLRIFLDASGWRFLSSRQLYR